MLKMRRQNVWNVFNKSENETKLFWSYFISTCFFVVSLITISLPWSHWAYTINICPSFDCECILFGKSFSDQFGGGKSFYCYLVTFLQVPLFLTAAVLSFYQGRQCLIIKRERRMLRLKNKGNEKNPILILKSRNGRALKEGDVVIEEKIVKMEPPSFRANVILIITSCICLAILLAVYFLTAVGYQWSCMEYRKMLVQLLKASGNMAQILTERLECTAIFSFMDFLQPKRRMFDPADYGRKTKINTGLSLYIGQLTLIANIVTWIYILVMHVIRLRKRLRIDRKQYSYDETDTRRRR